MTDRVKGFTVVLDKDFRIDDVEVIQNAIAMIKGVNSVQPLIANGEDYVVEQRTKSEIIQKLFKFIKEELK